MVVRLLAVALWLAWLGACSGQSGTEKDGGEDNCDVDFAVGPVLTRMEGTFVGDGLTVDVAVGEARSGCPSVRYVVPLEIGLRDDARGVDERLAVEAELADPQEVTVSVDVPAEQRTSTWTDPGMVGVTEVRYVHTLSLQDDGWSVAIGWRGTSGGTEVGGELGTWDVRR